MTLIKCVECGKEYSDKASACPICACPTEYTLTNSKKENKDNKKSISTIEPKEKKPNETNKSKSNSPSCKGTKEEKKLVFIFDNINLEESEKEIKEFLTKNDYKEENELDNQKVYELGYNRYVKNHTDGFGYKIQKQLIIEVYSHFKFFETNVIAIPNEEYDKEIRKLIDKICKINNITEADLPDKIKTTKWEPPSDIKSDEEAMKWNIKIIKPWRTERIINRFIRKNNFIESQPWFANEKNKYKCYYYKKGFAHKNFEYYIEDSILHIQSYETKSYTKPIENGEAFVSESIKPNEEYYSELMELVNELKDLNN